MARRWPDAKRDALRARGQAPRTLAYLGHQSVDDFACRDAAREDETLVPTFKRVHQPPNVPLQTALRLLLVGEHQACALVME